MIKRFVKKFIFSLFMVNLRDDDRFNEWLENFIERKLAEFNYETKQKCSLIAQTACSSAFIEINEIWKHIRGEDCNSFSPTQIRLNGCISNLLALKIKLKDSVEEITDSQMIEFMENVDSFVKIWGIKGKI
jgi:hypothetical protein